MLLYVKENNKILNLDNVVKIGVGGNQLIFNPSDIVAWGTDGNQHLVCDCKNAEVASKIINDIYTKMTYGRENMILDLDMYKPRCGKCVKFDTDACDMHITSEYAYTCDDYLTEEEVEKDVKEEK